MSRFHSGKSGLSEEGASARSTSFQSNELQKTTNTKLDTALVQQTAVNSKLDSLSGAINNNIGDATVKLQTYVYAHDVSNGLSRPLKCDSAGRLECSVDALEITAETINLSTDQLEAKVDAVTSKLDTFAGAGNNNIGEGSSKLQVFNYGRDTAAGNYKPFIADSSGRQCVFMQNDFASGTLLSNIVLANGVVNTTTLDLGATHDYKKVLLFGKCAMSSASDNFSIFVSNDNSNYFRIETIRPTLNSIDSAFHFGHKTQTARYVRIGNECGTNLTAFTLNFVKLR